MAKVGFIGVGVMGREMVINLLKAGHEVRVFDTHLAAAEALVAHGAVVAKSAGDAVRDADVGITMLPDTPQVEAAILGPDGVLSSPPAGGVFVEMSTISPQATRAMSAALAERGVSMLDGPVSGGPLGATNATLSIMVGGDEQALAKAMPVLSAMGKTIVHMGESGAGQVTKLCNQLVVGINLQGVCEALALGRAAGIDLEKLRDALLGGSASSWMMQNLAPKIIAKDPAAGFRIDLMLKDLRLTGELAFALGVPLPGNALVTNLFLEARAHGEGGNGNQALYRAYDRLTNQE
ncbi:NAD(P)-dependent oxidoreductase [Bosea sp. (in: a-proteobacteria)]|jgi:2-hydroxy-3-oxopropionate reductase|uniref:NAD(P)-dependent oxidoreductase n=1 Tax=Bosea sp. (in: a-proteobacteria) TaxID=1871050 RepID=UPI002DDD7B42|nr:NAD(P)-dependent oxidoreductase [Bosea sp. (in: a-proteobacteria)]HEV2508326.1 NAD(P)-dependent oxidoreductase [Bosea sp. (in: a-proteobacteria)]